MKEHIKPEELDLYALGALEPEELRRIEVALGSQPALRKELGSIESTLEQFAMLHKRNPAPSVRAKVMKSLLGEGKSFGRARRLGLAAVAAVSVAAVGIALWLGYEWKNEAEYAAILKAGNALLSANIDAERNRLKAAEKLLATLQTTNAAAFTAVAPTGESKGQLYWNRSKQEALFVAAAAAGQLTVSLYRNNELAAVTNAASDGLPMFYRFSLPEGIDSLRVADGPATEGMFGEANVKLQNEKPIAKPTRIKQSLLPKTGL